MSTKLKLIALPLTKFKNNQQFITLLPKPPISNNNDVTLLSKSINKFESMWNNLSTNPDGHWKKRTWAFGERLMDRVPYEEWALKGIDINHGPAVNTGQKLTILYPSSIIKQDLLMDKVKEDFASRSNLHRKYMFLSLGLSPITL